MKSVRNLGVILDWRLSMKEHINKMWQMAYWELRRISSISQYLAEDAATTLVVSLVLSRLDYGNCLLAGVPECLLHKLQNTSARLILKSCRQEHTKPLLKALHWLPISDRITYKLSCIPRWSFTNLHAIPYFTVYRTHVNCSKRNTQARDLSPIRVP